MFLRDTLLGEIITIIFSVLSARVLENTLIRWRYGGWTVHIWQHGAEVLVERIPAPKARELLQDPISLRIYLKGLTSAYAWLHVDLLSEGRAIGLFRQDEAHRRFVIDLDKNPQRGLGAPGNEATAA